jgi:hypothetical protein
VLAALPQPAAAAPPGLCVHRDDVQLCPAWLWRSSMLPWLMHCCVKVCQWCRMVLAHAWTAIVTNYVSSVANASAE